MTPFQVGQRVVCIDDTSLRLLRCGETTPKVGRIYTIRGWAVSDEGVGVYLVEIINYANWYLRNGKEEQIEVSWKQERFRPVRSSSIDVFKDLLVERPSKVSCACDASA